VKDGSQGIHTVFLWGNLLEIHLTGQDMHDKLQLRP